MNKITTVEYRSKLYTVAQFAIVVGQSVRTVQGKLNLGQTAEQIVEAANAPSKDLTLQGIPITVPKLARICGCVPVSVYQRLKTGMTGDQVYNEFKVKNNLPDLRFFNLDSGEKMNTEKQCLLGFAIGDALARWAETKTGFDPDVVAWADHPVYRISNYEGLGPSGKIPGAFTDDTQMTLCLSHACKKSFGKDDFSRKMTSAGAPMAVAEIALGFYSQWFKGWPQGKTVPGVIDGPRGIGQTVRTALTRHANEENWQGGVLIELSNSYVGNGALMRSLPLAMFYRNDMNALLRAVRYDTHNTHNSAEAYAASFAYCHVVASLLNGQLTGCMSRMITALEDAELEYTVVYEAMRHMRLMLNTRNDVTLNGLAKAVEEIGSSGYVVETLSSALYLGLKSLNFENMLVGSTLAGGDTDTRTALAGGIGAIRFGIETFPEMWVEGIESKQAILDSNQWLLENPYRE